MKKFAVILGVFSVLLLGMGTGLCQKQDASSSSGSGRLLEKSSVYAQVAQIFPQGESASQSLENTAIQFVFDLILSWGCLWLALLMFTGEKTLRFKCYGMFLLALNIAFFVLSLIAKGAWEVLDFLVIKIQPDLLGSILDKFLIAVPLLAIVFYVWLLARNFGMTSIGAIGTFLFSHLFYCGAVYLIFTYAITQPVGFNISKNTYGIQPIVHGYIADVDNIISNNSVLSFFRLRPFHL